MVIAIGYRVKSRRGIQFRTWATARLTHYIEGKQAMSNAGSPSLSELRALVRSSPWRAVDRTEKLIRSIQQSLQVEGYDVERAVVLEALCAAGQGEALSPPARNGELGR